MAKAEKPPLPPNVVRRAKDIRNQLRRTPGGAVHAHSIAHIRDLLRMEGLGAYTEDEIDSAIRDLNEPAPDFGERHRRFQQQFREDHPMSMWFPKTEHEWHQRMREMYVPKRDRRH